MNVIRVAGLLVQIVRQISLQRSARSSAHFSATLNVATLSPVGVGGGGSYLNGFFRSAWAEVART
jgi:hypothetical protein